jgi:D-alanyl-D-alanine carboxypeptidase
MLALLPQVIVVGLALGAVYALLALGITFIASIMKLINWSMGEFYMLGSYAQFVLITRWLGPGQWWLALPLAILGVFLLGLVIQRVEGKALGKVMHQQVVGPLGLARTSWPGRSPVLPKPRARGYTLQGQPPGEPADATNWNPSAAWAAGGMISTLHDLLVYGRAMGTGRGLLAPAQQKRRLDSFKPKVAPETPQLSYGIGMVNDLGWIGHTGQVPGYTTAVYYNPDIDTTVVVETNSDITSGICPPTLNDDPITRACATPADRMMGAIAGSLGHPYQLPPLG